MCKFADFSRRITMRVVCAKSTQQHTSLTAISYGVPVLFAASVQSVRSQPKAKLVDCHDERKAEITKFAPTKHDKVTDDKAEEDWSRSKKSHVLSVAAATSDRLLEKTVGYIWKPALCSSSSIRARYLSTFSAIYSRRHK